MIARLISVLAGIGTSLFLWFDSHDATQRQFAVIVGAVILVGFILLTALGIRA